MKNIFAIPVFNLFSKPFFNVSLSKSFTKIAQASLVAVLVFGLYTLRAEAYVPSLSVYSTTSNLVQLTVQADPNASVQLYYYQLGTNLLVGPTVIGATNSSGYFSGAVAQNAYGVVGGATVYVTVNGQQSATTVWPSTYTTGGNVYLSQPNVNLTAGQSTTVNIYGGTGVFTISSNSNPGIASVTISGNSLNVYGVGQGNTTLNICSSNSTSNCATLLVTVNGSYYGTGSVTVSQSSVFLNQGQSQTVTITGGGNYYISNSPSTSVASATINGSVLTIYGINPGSVSYSVCSGAGTYSCAPVYVNVSTYYNPNNNSYPYNYYNNYPYNYNGLYYQTYTYPTTYYAQPTSYSYPTNYYSSNYNAQTGTPVAGVFLNQIPNTGISFGLKIALFVLGVLLWSAFGAYMVYKKYPQLSVGLFGEGQGSVFFTKNDARNSQDQKMHLNKTLLFKENQMKKKGLN